MVNVVSVLCKYLIVKLGNSSAIVMLTVTITYTLVYKYRKTMANPNIFPKRWIHFTLLGVIFNNNTQPIFETPSYLSNKPIKINYSYNL